MGTIKKIESILEETVKSNEEIIAEAMALSAEQEKETKNTKKRTSRTKKNKETETKEKSKETDVSEIEIENIYDESKDSIKEKVAEIINSEEAVPETSDIALQSPVPESKETKKTVPDNSGIAPEPKKKSTRGKKTKTKEPEKELDIPFEDSLPRKKSILENSESPSEEKRYEHHDYPPVILYPPEKKKYGITIICVLTAALLVAAIVTIVMLFGIKEIHQNILDQISNNTKAEEPVTKEEKETSVVLETEDEIITDSVAETTKEKTTKSNKEVEKETTKNQEETTAEVVTKKSTGSEELDILCDNILNSIIKDSMTDTEKARAAYDWVTANISYVMSDKCDTWQEQAIQTITSYSGDCTGYYAILRALFERIGFECESVESITQEHIWVIAKVNGEWYHFDATPGWGSDRFMYTTDEMLSYAYYGNDKYPDGLKYSFSTSKLPKD